MLDRLKMLNFPTILFCGLTLYNNSGNSSISTTKYSSLIRNAATGKFEKNGIAAIPMVYIFNNIIAYSLLLLIIFILYQNQKHSTHRRS